MPKSEQTAATPKNSKSAGRANAPQALKSIKHYLWTDDGEGRREGILKLFHYALDSDGLDDNEERRNMKFWAEQLLELDKSLEVYFGNQRQQN